MSIQNDMHEHFVNKLRTLLQDTADTCQRIDMNSKEIIEVLISGLMGEALRGAVALGLTEAECLKMTTIGYRMVKKARKSML